MGSDDLARDAMEDAKELVHRFWACMDATLDIPCEDLFSETGVLIIDPVSSAVIEVSGQAALADFSRKRKETSSSTNRVTRHVVSNLRCVQASGTSMTLSGHVTDYVGSGALPLDLNAPSAVADFDYEFVADDTGTWRFSAIRGKIVFAGSP